MEFLKSLKRLLIATYSVRGRFALVLFIAPQPEYKGLTYNQLRDASLQMAHENF